MTGMARRRLSPLHPRKLWARLVHLFHRMGYFHLRLWVIGLHPRRIAATWRWSIALRRTWRRRRAEPRLTVAIDISPFWEPLTGIGWYLYRLLEELAANTDVKLRLYGPALVDKGDVPLPTVVIPEGPALELVSYRVPENLSFVHYYLADKLRNSSRRLIAADGNAVLFAPNFLMPSVFEDCSGALVSTVHDLAFLRVPDTMQEETRDELTSLMKAMVTRSRLVITDTETVRQELIETGWIEGELVRAIGLGPGAIPAPRATLPEQAPAKFVLYLGTIEPRKGLDTLLAAWRIFRAGKKDAPQLVLCGRLGWKSAAIEKEIDEGEQEGWLTFYGYLDTEYVEGLLRNALCLVLPSRYEGFGLPLLEAMSVGTPVVASDIPVLREVAADAALYIPPGSPQLWADGLERLLESDELHSELAERGRQRSRQYSWTRAASLTTRVWADAAEASK